MRYLPFLDGKYSTAPGLFPTEKAQGPDRLIFQIDDDYMRYRRNMQDCRREDIQKYFVQKNLHARTAVNVNMMIATQLVKEYPAIFRFTEDEGRFSLHNRLTDETLRWNEEWQSVEGSKYLNLFDALSSQVQEDIAVCQLEGDRDWLAAIHLCAPNHWSPEDKIGRPFGYVHGIVPGMEKLNVQYFKMLTSCVQKGPFYRFAWGISTDKRLNHHPHPPPDIDAVTWHGRSLDDEDSRIYCRVERQALAGIPSSNAFIFTIRTYFYDSAAFAPSERIALLAAIESMSDASLAYKGLTGKLGILRERLSPTGSSNV